MTSDERTLHPALKIGGLVLLALIGAAVGAATARFIDAAALPADDALNLFIGVVLIGMGVVMGGILALRPTEVPKGCGLLQILVLTLAGIVLIVPIYGSNWLSAEVSMAIVLGLLAIQTVANVMMFRQADEMLRRVMVETGALAFWVLQLALFVYAASERLGLVEGITAWGMIGIMMAVYMVASAVAGARRGLK
ncbi:MULTISPECIES: hypothetical protein [unclassified Brevundimonas]|jgi:hypothetical protein|uniref:hypothetical protein n=1 Tax=unclassified Brevundimonas TaxID=2622653 RepID=UPI000C4224BD|nr:MULTISPECIES: hypothetical protein [unclassified Brevundimonas]MAL89216.1 hypothetical protein [Brevundimonas sp.]HAJ01806.1 hypothetical protein [Brevundimonas sp.]HAV50232.1 hypothetical protein [Brevundimonas sp.]|tara:strand:+ start:2146 stop:2727 length:582 start_codon:yes stop_codon:yes gene_type:complete